MGRNGQAVTETIVLLPLFFLLVFGLLQLGQLGTALLVANYAASAMARQMVQDNSTTANKTRFTNMLTAGMKSANVEQDIQSTGVFANVTVHACADIDAFPFVNQILGGVLSRVAPGGAGNCKALGTFGYTSSPPRFTVHGQAEARMNYRPA
jgi:Flp pilus assembly protein TadG